MISAPPNTPTKAAPRLALLDALRFAAAFVVVAYHFTARDNDAWGTAPEKMFPDLHQLTAFGAFGVDLFFIISGYVILMSAWGRSVAQFVASRVGRLFPAYWTAVLLTGFLLIVLWPDERTTTVPQVLANLTMTQAAFGIPHVDAVYWTLWTELRFYGLMALFMAIGITTRRVILVAAVFPVLAGMAQQADFGFLSSVMLNGDAAYFAGGMMLYVVSRNPRSLIAWLVLGMNVWLASGWSSQGTVRRILESTPVEPAPLTVAAIIVGCFAVVAAIALTPLKHINWRWLTVIGALTYPLYLIHEYWGWWFISLLSGHVPAVLTLAAATLACVAMAWLINRYVERPLGPALKRAVDRSITELEPKTRMTRPRRNHPNSDISRPTTDTIRQPRNEA